MSSHSYLLLTLACYAVGALDVVVHATMRRRLLTSWTMTATLVGFALHTASLSQRWTEAGHFQLAGVPTVICGPGSIEQAHRADEWIALSELEACAAFLRRLADALSS